jgi:uncharacterized tellurite resistance protein B-like protein
LQEQASNIDVDLHLVAAILIFSVIRADGDIDHKLDNMVDILRSRYALSSEQISALITSARDASISDHGLELLAQKLCHHWNSNERQQLLNDFWLLATADRIIKNDERLVIELIANNLELEDGDITHARYQAEQRLELNIG